jgi:hypothetical protein
MKITKLIDKAIKQFEKTHRIKPDTILLNTHTFGVLSNELSSDQRLNLFEYKGLSIEIDNSIFDKVIYIKRTRINMSSYEPDDF